MDDGSLTSWIALLLLILLHAIITLGFVALKNVRQSLLREQAENGNAHARRVLSLTADFARLQLTTQLTLTLIRFAIAGLATIGAELLLVNPAQVSPLAGFVLVLLPTALLTLILGDLAPSAIASAQADSLALGMVYPIRWLVALMTPLALLITT
ncbi:MAG: DUF21 domain-containing protein, partial [Acidobacteriales bacterium]|nr:DUF21 domain-containing protein [Terriglobales bacterium]